MTPLELLVAGRAVIADPKHWTKRTLARNSKMEMVDPHDSHATCFCSIGALHKAAGRGPQTLPLKYDVEARLIEAAGRGIIAANDDNETTHEMILGVWDKAIANAVA